MTNSERKLLSGTLCLDCPHLSGVMPTESRRAREVCCDPDGEMLARLVVSKTQEKCRHVINVVA